MTELEAELISNFDAREFVEHYYEPVEDKPGYVWLSKRNMQIISIDVLVEALECSSFGRCLRKNVAESEEDA